MDLCTAHEHWMTTASFIILFSYIYIFCRTNVFQRALFATANKPLHYIHYNTQLWYLTILPMPILIHVKKLNFISINYFRATIRQPFE